MSIERLTKAPHWLQRLVLEIGAVILVFIVLVATWNTGRITNLEVKVRVLEEHNKQVKP